MASGFYLPSFCSRPFTTLFRTGIYAYSIVVKARWAHLSTSHHIKPEPLGWDEPISPYPTMYFHVRLSIWNGKIKLSSEAYRRECEMGWSHHTSRSESQQHECRNVISLIPALGRIHVQFAVFLSSGAYSHAVCYVSQGRIYVQFAMFFRGIFTGSLLYFPMPHWVDIVCL